MIIDTPGTGLTLSQNVCEIVAPLIRSMSQEAIESVRELERMELKSPQVPIRTQTLLHGGMCHRTIEIPAGVRVTGALVKVPTTLTISGDVVAFTGEGEVRYVGYRVIPARAYRKQVFVALTDTYLTMSFPTRATTAEEVEAEFTDECNRLTSRRDGNEIIITGEL